MFGYQFPCRGQPGIRPTCQCNSYTMVLRVGKDLDESNSGKVMEPMANRHSPEDGKLSQCLLFEMILVWNWGSDEHSFSIAN